MKGKIYTLIVLASIGSMVIGCKTASKLYGKGNYDEAVELAAKKLQKNPDDRELKALLQDAYRYAVDDHENRIRTHSASSNELKWEWIYHEYASLQRLYEAIRRSPEAFRIVHAADYSSYLNIYAEKAADTRYERGLRWMDRNDKMSFRNAYNEFSAALRYKPGDHAIKSRLDEAYHHAVVHVVILPAEDYRFRYSSYNNYELRNLDEELLRNLRYHSGNHFVKFYSQWDARSGNIQPDQFIDLRFSTMNIGRVRDEQSTREVAKEVVLREIVYRPDSVVKVYGKVTARITTTKRTLRSDGNLQVNIRDDNGRWLWNDNFRGDHMWTTEFATFTGDERALSESDKQLVSRRPDNPPHEDEIIRYIVREINSTLHQRIRDYYNRY
jgi:tetratricopeptide (TPR) repeat protein